MDILIEVLGGILGALLEFLLPIALILVIGFILLCVILSKADSAAQKKETKQKERDTHQYLQTHAVNTSLSSIINTYRKTGKLDPRYYAIDDELRSIVGYGYGLYPSSYVKDLYFEDWKDTITAYRRLLIENLEKGKDYPTSKGTIRVVPIVHSWRGLRLETEHGQAAYYRMRDKKGSVGISPNTMVFMNSYTIPDEVLNILGRFGFTLLSYGDTDEKGWSTFDVVAYINLGT